MVEGINWKVAGVRVDGVRMDQPERTRGEMVGLSCIIRRSEDDGGLYNSGLYGEGLYASGLARSRYESLRAYGSYAGEGASYQLIGGLPAVHENPRAEWPVDSHIVSVEPGEDVYATPGFWALVTGYSDDSVILGQGAAVYELDFDLVFLADFDEFTSRDELVAEMSPVTVQFPEE